MLGTFCPALCFGIGCIILGVNDDLISRQGIEAKQESKGYVNEMRVQGYRCA